MPRIRSSLRAAAAVAVLLLLSACTVTFLPGETEVRTRGRVTFGFELDPVIRSFAPARGEGSTYRVGEAIAFDIRTDRDGYVTLSAIDPDGDVYVFARDLYVRAGTTRITGPSSRTEFALVPPRGLHRVRASFTDAPTRGRVTYRGVAGGDAWTATIRTDIRPAQVRAVEETHFYLR